MNLIQTELYNSKSKSLVAIPGTQLVLLSPDNVAIVEAMIQMDSSYRKSSDKNAIPDKKYRGSTAYWMTQLKSVLIESKPVSNNKYRDIISGAIEAVDRENSTHLNADGVGREEIKERIIGIPREKLVFSLKEPESTDLWLIKCIAGATHPSGKSASGKEYKSRTNVSFASKFCHYACFYLFEGTEWQDNYSIYDNVLKKALPKYINYYGLRKRNLNDYAEYRKSVDEIIEKADCMISRNGFDHLLWYYYKGERY